MSLGYEHQSYPVSAEGPYAPRTILIGDNFNRTVGTENWGKAEKIDVFHLMAKLQEVFAPPNLSRTDPLIPLDQLCGKSQNLFHGTWKC